jgi:predicted nuclease of predicted toxin-antitoxin system
VWAFLVDEDMPRSTAHALKAAGYSVADVRDVGLRSRPDSAVFVYAQSAGAIIVTGDLGFASILNFPPAGHAGIIVVRLPNKMTSNEVNSQIIRALTELEGEDLRGCVVVVEPGRTRLHRGI